MNKLKVNYNDKMAYYEISYFLKDYINSNTIIVCIGTDRCIGDCLGPLVGTMLKEKYFPLPVYGTVSSPIHALNLEQRLTEIKILHPKSNILGIDACLGEKDSIGEIHCRDYPIHPGKGVGKNLPDVGDSSIIGIVDSSDSDEIFTNRNIRLSFVLDIAKTIVHSLFHTLYFNETTF